MPLRHIDSASCISIVGHRMCASLLDVCVKVVIRVACVLECVCCHRRRTGGEGRARGIL
jgi:hypothetical protein